jgi:RNA polymerase sigma-70 factor, ECF subfamily
VETIDNQLDQLIRLYANELFRYLYRLTHDYYLAEDILQETFYKVYSHLDSMEEVTHIRSWLYRIAYNTFVDYCRKNKNLSLYEDSFFASLQLNALWEPENTFFRKYQIKLIYKHLSTMKELQQKAIVLVDLNGFSYKEAAALLKIKPSYLKSLVFRGRRELKKRLSGEVKEWKRKN